MKTILIFACAGLGLLSTYVVEAQTSFGLRNGDRGVNAPVFDAQGVPLAGGNYLVELWGGATSDSLAPAVSYYSRQRVIIPFLTDTSAGYFMDSYAGRDGADHPSILSVPTFGWAWLEVRAWDARLGATYEDVLARGLGGYGESALFYAQGGAVDLLSIPAPLTGLQSFSLREIIPEPSTVLLLLLGLPWLVCRWHRRE